jgi:hypothetical protein
VVRNFCDYLSEEWCLFSQFKDTLPDAEENVEDDFKMFLKMCNKTDFDFGGGIFRSENNLSYCLRQSFTNMKKSILLQSCGNILNMRNFVNIGLKNKDVYDFIKKKEIKNEFSEMYMGRLHILTQMIFSSFSIFAFIRRMLFTDVEYFLYNFKSDKYVTVEGEKKKENDFNYHSSHYFGGDNIKLYHMKLYEAFVSYMYLHSIRDKKLGVCYFRDATYPLNYPPSQLCDLEFFFFYFYFQKLFYSCYFIYRKNIKKELKLI